MSEANVAIVRGMLEQFQKGELEQAFEQLSPEIEWDATRLKAMIPDIAGLYRGHEGVRAYWRSWLQAWNDLEFEIGDVLDAGDEVVALIVNQRQWGRRSGIVTQVPEYAIVFTFTDGLVSRWRSYPDRAEAMRDVGLPDGS